MQIRSGRYRLDAALDDRLRQASGAAARVGDVAHPAIPFVLALGGAGEEIGAVLGRLGYDIACAPLLATCRIDLLAPLLVDSDYDVAGQVSAIVRKPSRRFGAADHLHIGYTLSRAGQVIATVDLVMVIRAQTSE